MEGSGSRAELSCADVHDAAPGFALDILDADRRAHVAAHLIRCPSCRAVVTDMERSAADLLDLSCPEPAADTPAASRLPVVTPARRRVRVALTLAAAATLLVATAVAPELEQRAARPGPAPVATATLTSDGRAVGGVYFFGGTAPSMTVQVHELRGGGPVTCEVMGDDGRIVRLGSFRLYQGTGFWATTTRIDRDHLVSVELVDTQGRTVASTSGS